MTQARTMEPTQDEFKGATALVTGASGGIGAATAVALASRGVSILLHYNSNSAGAFSVKDQVTGYGVDCELIKEDLSSATGVQSLCETVKHRRIDILINNAGSLIQRARVADLTFELWEQVLMLNFTSAMFLAKAVLPGMVERKRGTIVNLSSVAAKSGGGLGAIPYSSSKAAVSTMTKGLAKEFAPLGIHVNAVSPGTIDTGFHRAFSTEEMLDNVRAVTPAGRIGTSEEVADTILFLCSDAARFIHGQVIEINGGFLMA
jgi:NAD(P)-dependent dehydrogenase (short-subunit alcohol dehydrogenase family)